MHGYYENSTSVETTRCPSDTSTCDINQACTVNLAGSKRMSGYKTAFNQCITSAATRPQGVTSSGHRLADQGVTAQHYSLQSTVELLFQGMDTLCVTYRPYDTGLHFVSARHLLSASCNSTSAVRACRRECRFLQKLMHLRPTTADVVSSVRIYH